MIYEIRLRQCIWVCEYGGRYDGVSEPALFFMFSILIPRRY